MNIKGSLRVYRGLATFIFAFGLFLALAPIVLAAPSNACNSTADGQFIQTVERHSTRGTTVKEYVKWKCGHTTRQVYSWSEVGRQTAAFDGVAYDSSVAAEDQKPGSGNNNNPPPSGSTPAPGSPPGGSTPAPTNGGSSGGAVTVSFPNPLKYDTVQDVVGSLLKYLQGIIVLLSLVFIVIGAVLYITSAGNENQTKMAKRAITAAMIGMAIGVAAPTFLREIADILQWKEPLPDNVSAAVRLAKILANLLSFLLGIVGVLALIMLVVGGIMYLFSGGDEKRAGTGKGIVRSAIIGIAIALAGLVLVRQIALFFAS